MVFLGVLLKILRARYYAILQNQITKYPQLHPLQKKNFFRGCGETVLLNCCIKNAMKLESIYSSRAAYKRMNMDVHGVFHFCSSTGAGYIENTQSLM